jgi:hypothetical protein
VLQEPGQPLEEIHRLFEIMEEVTRKFVPCLCLVGMMTQGDVGRKQGLPRRLRSPTGPLGGTVPFSTTRQDGAFKGRCPAIRQKIRILKSQCH